MRSVNATNFHRKSGGAQPTSRRAVEGSAVSLNPKPMLAERKSLYEGHGFSRAAGVVLKRANERA
jgi:hypothetical protein